MSIPLASLAHAPLHPLRPDGPRPRALLMDPKTGISLRLVFQKGRIVLLALSPTAPGLPGNDGVWPIYDHDGAALSPNWIKIGDLLDGPSPLPRDTPLAVLASRFAAAVDQAAGAAAVRRATALRYAAQAWLSTQSVPLARFHSVLRTPQGAVLCGNSVTPSQEFSHLSLPGGMAFDRAMAPLRTFVNRHPIAPVGRLYLGKFESTSAHAALALLTQADALFAAAGMSPSDRAAYLP